MFYFHTHKHVLAYTWYKSYNAARESEWYEY
jgi:hypothetical protein